MRVSGRSETPQGPDTRLRGRKIFASNAFRVGIVLLAAAIIFGAWAFAEWGPGQREDDDPGIVLTLDDEYERARRAAESGDTDEAIEILERILAEDPGHERASALLRQLRQDQAANDAGAGGQTGSDDGAGPGDDPGEPSQPQGQEPDQPRPVADSVLLAPVNDLSALLPQVIAGWERGSPVASDTNATVSFSPVNQSALARALFSVNDMGSVDAARAFIEDTSKVAYATDAATVRIGREQGYFGTDGSRLATAVFSRGRYVFEVVVTVSEGTPSAAREATVSLAGEFQASR